MARIGWFGKWAMKRMSRFNVFLYRVSGGRLGGKFPSGAPILLLTTIGRKSGKARTLPLLYLEDGERLVIVASKGGHDHHPRLGHGYLLGGQRQAEHLYHLLGTLYRHFYDYLCDRAGFHQLEIGVVALYGEGVGHSTSNHSPTVQRAFA